MNQTQLAQRQERAATEPLVIQQVEEGFRVYAADEPKHCYIVSGSVNAPQCTCPDFQYHRGDPDWQCKHILAVLKEFSDIDVVAQHADPVEAEERRAIQEEGRKPRRLRATNAGNGNGKPEHGATLTLKRSVSPDGRIDSLSVEFSAPIRSLSAAEIQTQAEQLLDLQSGIVAGFLNGDGRVKGNGAGNGNRGSNGSPAQTPRSSSRPLQAAPSPVSSPSRNGPAASSPKLTARLVAVGGMNTQRGRRLFLTVEVGGKMQKLFGTADELIRHITTAGYRAPEPFQEGAALNMPCLVTTKPSPDGRYQNVEEVFRAPAPTQSPQRWRR